METTRIIIYLISVSWFVTNTSEMLEIVNQFLKGFKKGLKFLAIHLTCIKCVSFWLTLIFTMDFCFATFVSLLAYILDAKVLNSFKL